MNEQKRLDRLDREKIFKLIARIWGEDYPLDEALMESAMYWVYEFEALIPDIEAVRKQAADTIKGIVKMYEEDEANTIEEAKKQGVAELLNWLKEYSIHGSKVPLEDVLIDIQAHSPYEQALKV